MIGGTGSRRPQQIPRFHKDEMTPLTHLLSAWRKRLAAPMEDRESVVVGTLAVGYLAAALALAFALPSGRELEPVVVLGLLAASVGVSLIRFDVGAGYVCAEQLVYVPLLFFAPLPLVLLLVPVAYALSDLPDFLAGRAHRDRWMNALADSWFAIGSVTVLGLFAPGAPQLELATVYLAALAAQVGLGTSAALAREYFVGRLSVRDELRSAAAAYQLDVMLSPIGLALAFAAAEFGPVALLAILPVAGGLFWLSRLHRERCDRLVAEHEAYWRRFLRDARRLERSAQLHVSEDWRCMPELALAVGAELRLDMEARANLAQAAQAAGRRVTLAAHADREHAHAAERRLKLAAALIAGRLYQAGADGLVSRPAFDRFTDQAELVRLSSERFDGRGSPDGLRGEEIPLGARILACCGAYSSMTAGTDDRAPMSAEIAVEELRRAAGYRFDPAVVGALSRALRHEELGEPPSPTRSPWLIDQLRPAGPASLGGRTTTLA
jgi:HD domain